LGRRFLLVGAILVASLLVGATGAGAASTFTDTPGDAVGGAADFTQLVVSNDFDGNITFAFTFANRAAFTDDDLVLILLNSDKNASTGTSGADFAIGVGNLGGILLRGDGTSFQLASAGTLKTSNNNMTVTINRSDLGGTTGFLFLAVATLNSNSDAQDLVPETGAAYDLDLKPTLDTLAAHFSPAKPKAGKVFRLAGTTLRLDDGTSVKADSITCVAKLSGKRLAGRCSWRIPVSARGKRLAVTLTARYKGASATFTPWRFVVR